MAAHPPVRTPSTEWAGKDRPVFYRSPSSQLRHQASASKNPFARDATKQDTASHRTGSLISSAGASVPLSSSTNTFVPSDSTSAASTQASSPPVNASIPTAASASAKDPASPASPPVRSLEPEGTNARAGVRNSVECAIESVSETVKPYLPESVAAYLPTSATKNERTSVFPSKEIPGGSGVGVGSLPGDISETSVAKLPEERALESRQKASHHKHGKGHTLTKKTTNPSTSPSMYQNAKNYFRRSLGAYLPGGTSQSSQLPSKETPGGSTVGVGSLPGNTSEVSVAKLPEERRLEGMPSHETDHEVLGKSGGVGALPGGPNESRVALLPEERIHPQYDAGPKAMGYAGAAGMGISRAKDATVEHDHEVSRQVPGAFNQKALGTESREGDETGLHETAAAGIGAGVVGTAAAAHHASSKQARVLSCQLLHLYLTLSDQGNDAGFGGTAAHPDVRLDPGYHPAELHPPDPKFKDQETKPSSSDSNGGNTKRHSSASAESDRHSSTSSGERRKSRIVNKMKGEVKVISGKLSRNEKKIEEGKQMMGK
ncbi:hypothetical protein J132_02294 [Termitomyces sp. J132]|nr:hypothetical protein J132_02294 [Termitomyces sp. J132]